MDPNISSSLLGPRKNVPRNFGKPPSLLERCSSSGKRACSRLCFGWSHPFLRFRQGTGKLLIRLILKIVHDLKCLGFRV